MPWLMERVTDQLEKSELGRLVLDGMLREVTKDRLQRYARLEERNRQLTLNRDAPQDVTDEADNTTSEQQSAPATTTDVRRN